MQNFYESTKSLDERATTRYGLSPAILVENAANGLLELIKQKAYHKSVVTIICGSGDNGADGYALARKLSGSFVVRIYQAKEPKSELCIEMCEKAQLIEGIKFITKILPCDVVVDCLFGSGLQGKLNDELLEVIRIANLAAPLKIACDIPSGLNADVSNTNKDSYATPALFGEDSPAQKQLTNELNKWIFKAHYTVCMGALKSVLLSDLAKDYVGEIVVADLGISRHNYEITSPLKLLEKSDLHLPTRRIQNAHKGNFGHLCVFSGDKEGASILSAQAGLHFGVGLASILNATEREISVPYEIMQTSQVPQNTTAIALGMGLGSACKEVLKYVEGLTIPCVIDADAFYSEEITQLLHKDIVLTPHPKEFQSLLKLCGFTDTHTKDKITLALAFSQKYPQVTLVLKGANTIIAKAEKIYLNTFGSVALAKGGSGDVLAGMIGALIAQGRDCLNASINASLAHAIAGSMNPNSYALTPTTLIANLEKL